MSALDTPRDVDSTLLQHARIGLQRIHAKQPQNAESSKSPANKIAEKEKTTKYETRTTAKSEQKETQAQKKYISIKQIPKNSIYYQHGKQGMKYWYEENKPMKYESKIPMGRKGTLLGLVDAPYK